MTKFEFDNAGNMTATVLLAAKDEKGNDVLQSTQHVIQASQIEKHFPMFKAGMSTAEKAEAAAIIAEQSAE